MKAEILFLCLFIGIIAYALYKFLLPCFENGRGASPPRSRPSPGSGWFSGIYDDYRRPPPPYSKYPNNSSGSGSGSTSQARGEQDRFGFWSGAALGGLGTYLLTRERNPGPQARRYDWENIPRRDPDHQAPRASGAFSPQPSWSDNRAGPSNLGPTRRSTGFGGSTVR